MLEKNCIFCGKPFKAKPSVALRRKYCSHECAGKVTGFKKYNDKGFKLAAKNGINHDVEAVKTDSEIDYNVDWGA